MDATGRDGDVLGVQLAAQVQCPLCCRLAQIVSARLVAVLHQAQSVLANGLVHGCSDACFIKKVGVFRTSSCKADHGVWGCRVEPVYAAAVLDHQAVPGRIADAGQCRCLRMLGHEVTTAWLGTDQMPLFKPLHSLDGCSHGDLMSLCNFAQRGQFLSWLKDAGVNQFCQVLRHLSIQRLA